MIAHGHMVFKTGYNALKSDLEDNLSNKCEDQLDDDSSKQFNPTSFALD